MHLPANEGLFFSQTGNDPCLQQEASCNIADKAAFQVPKKNWMKEVRSTFGTTHLLTTQLTLSKLLLKAKKQKSLLKVS